MFDASLRGDVRRLGLPATLWRACCVRQAPASGTRRRLQDPVQGLRLTGRSGSSETRS
jgi:hypothetical protein